MYMYNVHLHMCTHVTTVMTQIISLRNKPNCHIFDSKTRRHVMTLYGLSCDTKHALTRPGQVTTEAPQVQNAPLDKKRIKTDR